MNNINSVTKKVECSLSGLLCKDFITKEVSNKIVYQGKIFINNYLIKDKLLNFLVENSNSEVMDANISNSVIVNIWNIEIYEQYKDVLKKGIEIEMRGTLKYKVYNRFFGAKHIQLFFNVNSIYKIKQSLRCCDDDTIYKNRLPQITYSQF